MIHSEKAIGLFGGTFDPVHIGHLIVAEWLSEVLKIKTTYFIPAKIHPFVSKSNISSSDNRIEMLSLALKEYPDFKISDVEIKRQEVSYTIDTIKFFKDEFPDSELYFYMGMDNLNTLEQWKDPNEILKMCYVVVYNFFNISFGSVFSKFFNGLFGYSSYFAFTDLCHSFTYL